VLGTVVLLADDGRFLLADEPKIVRRPDAPGPAVLPGFSHARPPGRSDDEEDDVNGSRRAAGLGLLAYGLGTAAAFMSIGSPGGDYEEATVSHYVASAHWLPAFLLAYLGAFAAVGFLVAARALRTELGAAGDLFWGLSVGGTAAGVVGWFMVGGVAVAAAEGGAAAATVPHPVIYTISEISNLVAVCASAFLIGLAALVLAARSRLPMPVRVFSGIAGVCGILAPVFFPIFIFWLWAIVAGVWAVLARVREPATPAPVAQPA
jgi:hypothetical protein